MRHRDVVAVDGVVDASLPLRGEVGDELVAVQVPVDPGVGAAALLEAEHLGRRSAGRQRGRRRARQGGMGIGELSSVVKRSFPF